VSDALPRALFVCVHNAGRSQMAQCFWEALGGAGRSAGSAPAARVHPEVVAAMAEVGMYVAGRTPRALTTDDAEWAEVVITMRCGDACPLIPGRRYVDWELDDPSGKEMATVRAVRDEIRRRVNELAAETGTIGERTTPSRGHDPQTHCSHRHTVVTRPAQQIHWRDCDRLLATRRILAGDGCAPRSNAGTTAGTADAQMDEGSTWRRHGNRASHRGGDGDHRGRHGVVADVR